MINNTEFTKKFEENLSQNVKLSNYSWFNLGGNAEYFFKARDKNQLLEFLEYAKKKNINTTVIGAGSNILFRDTGLKGAVIKLGPKFSYTKLIENDIIDAGAATLDRKVANFAIDNALGNFEFLSCIPGSIGGAIMMNCGCYENEISKILTSVKVVDKNKLTEIEIEKKDIKFFYRGTNLSDDMIVISAKFKGLKSIKSEIEKKQINLIEKKKIAQPSQIKTCGSTFKNIDNKKKAWMIIKEAGCDNFSEGDAVISKKHCNFFVNNGKAKASDIEKLIQKVRKKVLDQTGINLELEIKIIGD